MNHENLKKVRPLLIWEILKQESDEDHPIKTDELRRRLAVQGINCDRRTLYADIDLLNSVGYEIIKHRAISNEYFVVDRSFDIPELLILMAAVEAASFITKKKTPILVDKLARLAGNQRADVLKQNIVQFSTVKSINENIYYSVSEISTAINQGKKIGFSYFDYDIDREKIYRVAKSDLSKQKRYEVSPVAMVFANDNYYLFCYDDWHTDVARYRIDRMDKVVTLDIPVTLSKEQKDFNLAKHKLQLFGMYGGEQEQVTLHADKYLLDILYDKFGENIRITELSESLVSATADVQVSPTFLAWCCSFGNRLKVVSPKTVVEKVKTYLEELTEQYN